MAPVVATYAKLGHEQSADDVLIRLCPLFTVMHLT